MKYKHNYKNKYNENKDNYIHLKKMIGGYNILLPENIYFPDTDDTIVTSILNGDYSIGNVINRANSFSQKASIIKKNFSCIRDDDVIIDENNYVINSL